MHCLYHLKKKTSLQGCNHCTFVSNSLSFASKSSLNANKKRQCH